MYYESKLRRSIDEAMNGRCNGERLKVQMEVARTAYDNESAEVKEKVQARLEELRLLDATGNMALGSGSASDDSAIDYKHKQVNTTNQVKQTTMP